MKITIVALVATVFASLAGLGVALAKSPESVLKLHEPIHDAIANEDVDTFMELLDPALENEIDRPVLLAWMRGMNQAAGTNLHTLGENVQYQVRFTPESKQIHTRVDLKFTEGIVDSSLVIANDRVIGFSINTDAMKTDWFDGPADAKMYFQRAELVLRGVLNGEYDRTRKLMHPSLIEAAPDAKLDDIRSTIVPELGEIVSVTANGGEFENTPEADTLLTRFVIQGTQGRANATATTLFDGLKGTIVSINYVMIESPQAETEQIVRND